MLWCIACQSLPDSFFLQNIQRLPVSQFAIFFSWGMADNCFVSFPILRPDHPDEVFMNIKEIMTMIIKESEDIPMQLLNTLVSILISSVKKENQVLNFLYKFIYLSFSLF